MVTRRRAIGEMAALALAFQAVQPSIGHAAEAAGDKVFLDYTQAELDRAYDQSAWAPNSKDLIRKYATDSASVRDSLAFQTIAYGDGDDETMDVFRSGRPNSPIHVHVHGGAWRSLTKADASFMAPPFLTAGAAYVALDFSVMPKARLPDMVDQVRRAIVRLHTLAGEIGGDSNRIHVSGHSSGGHMAGVLMTTDWRRFGLPPDAIKSGVLMSGMYDLVPVMKSSRSSYVTLSSEEIEALSPIRHLDTLVSPALVAYGAKESPEFKRQSQAFVSAAAEAGKAAFLLPAGDVNHFEMPYLLLQPETALTRLSLAMMGLHPT